MQEKSAEILAQKNEELHRERLHVSFLQRSICEEEERRRDSTQGLSLHNPLSKLGRALFQADQSLQVDAVVHDSLRMSCLNANSSVVHDSSPHISANSNPLSPSLVSPSMAKVPACSVEKHVRGHAHARPSAPPQRAAADVYDDACHTPRSETASSPAVRHRLSPEARDVALLDNSHAPRSSVRV
jgi:hypothetical protein